MDLSPQERTWNQLQENLHRKRKPYQQPQEPQGNHYGRYRRTPPSPVLPRLVDSPADAPLRGSHYPVIPPVQNEKYHNDDTLSLVSYSSELGQLDDNDEEDGYMGIPFSQSPDPYHHHHPHAHQGGAYRGKPPPGPTSHGGGWNASTHVRRDKTPYLQRGDGRRPAGRRPAKPQGAGSHGRGPGANHARGRPVWRNPDEGEAEELQDESALVVQRHYRGYKTRKNLDMLGHLQNPSFSLSFMHHFLKDVLQNDILLDVACEALIEERTRKKKNDMSRGMTKRLSMSFDPSPEQSFWTEALTRPEIHKPVASSLMQELIYEETRLLISECINELLDDYFESKAVGESTHIIMTELVREMMPDVVVDSMWEVVAESVVELFVDEETAFYVGCVLQDTMIRGAAPLDEQEEQQEIKEVSDVAEGVLLETAILDHMLAMVVRSGQAWNETEEADRFLDNWLSDVLFRQYAGILHARKSTEECVPLKRQHEVVVTDVALDTLLTELMQELEEDLKDLDESETGMDLEHL